MNSLLRNYFNKVYNTFCSLLPTSRQELFIVISTTKAPDVFFDKNKIIQDINYIVKNKIIGPISIQHKTDGGKLTISINCYKQSSHTDNVGVSDDFNSYLSSLKHDQFSDLYNQDTEDIICILEYSVPKDTKKYDILNLDLIRISPIIKGLGLEIEKTFHPYAVSHHYKYIVAYHIRNNIVKHFCSHGNRVRLVSLDKNLQTYLCDSPELRNKYTVVLLDQITTQS